MNIATLRRLKKNPHYKLTAEQRRMLEEGELKSSIEFGAPPIHNSTYERQNLAFDETRKERKQ